MKRKFKAERRVLVGDFRLESDEKKVINHVLEGGKISEWRKVKEFERVFAKYIGTKYCVAVSSGTAALIIGLLALRYDERFPKAKRGAKVIVSPISYISTVNSLVLTGFDPVFVDIDKRKFKIKTDQVEKAIKEHGKENVAGIMPVHLMGYPNDMIELNEIAEKNELFLFEDSAQAHGSVYNGKKTGSLGLLASFSFYIAHNIQAGELGCITTDDIELYKVMCQLKANGRVCKCPVCTRSQGVCPGAKKYSYDENDDYDPRFTHEYISYNFKTTEFPTALGILQVKKADSIFKKRQGNVKYLNNGLRGLKDLFYLPVFNKNVSYLAYPLIIKENTNIKRKHLREELENRGIENRPLFGCIPTQQPCYEYLKNIYKDKLPIADYLGKNAFYIGCHQYLKTDDLDYIIKVFRDMFNR